MVQTNLKPGDGANVQLLIYLSTVNKKCLALEVFLNKSKYLIVFFNFPEGVNGETHNQLNLLMTF